ncbi:hypothetical protein N7457_009329 [Penicillium paradoxum]|uniref:uncharacterized protein n=1 Tax=Penicillium paradoxum TaxID=176176 RepID=UPI00254968A4|nr:uncharacterized protein N7457_009329 [Penicillium paradoxum]KAJ5774433.1 hypothetical protein N7457_009329 [Penicillium paradoxum]
MSGRVPSSSNESSLLPEEDFASPHSSADEEYDSDEPPELNLNFQELKECASTVASARCINIRKLTRGRYHEIFLLDFEPGSETKVEVARAQHSCIARLTRGDESLAKATSELATMRYVKDHTSIPVATILHQDLRSDNPVGAPFVLMERLRGRHLYKLWDGLSLDHKKDVLTQIASVLTRLAALHFDGIGSLQDDGLGPLVHPSLPRQEEKPFQSTLDYLSAFAREDTVEDPKHKDLYQQVRQELEKYFSSKSDASYLKSPFRLIHGDFDAQNLLFTKVSDTPDNAPVLSGVIDFEYSYAGPLYYLYEYPIFIQDVDFSPELYEDNAILRPHFVRALQQSFPEGSPEAIAARDVMHEKNFILNDFPRLITLMANDSSEIGYFLQNLRNGTGLAYSGRQDYVPDPEQ